MSVNYLLSICISRVMAIRLPPFVRVKSFGSTPTTYITLERKVYGHYAMTHSAGMGWSLHHSAISTILRLFLGIVNTTYISAQLSSCEQSAPTGKS
ncbi:hypothetical protein IW261DRAFT_1528475 [Armillaria novae-zelandiae]|uniref:Uncharacterized protein n=1 Tax=Armillaria novae-zelandiae TaxID=153914 RepID=A0AA39NAM6_9AGAR|nr:hypothetical protein IW261DRAFT_1528475 [Armillaria novae-zelandiae]